MLIILQFLHETTDFPCPCVNSDLCTGSALGIQVTLFTDNM